MNNPELSQELQNEYRLRFASMAIYRNRVWGELCRSFFQDLLGRDRVILDLGCGWGEFINNVQASRKFGMDLNPESPSHLDQGVEFLHQDCSKPWPLEDNGLDVVFTSNFFEHLPDKETLKSTLEQAFRCLRPGGQIVCMGPNIKFLPGLYWNFWDHFLPLTEISLSEGLRLRGFEIVSALDKFLPYTMVQRSFAPMWLIRLYLQMPWVWRLFGKQFLVVARKPENIPKT